MQCVFAFVEGNLSTTSFLDAFFSDETIQDSLQKLMNNTNFNSALAGNNSIGMQSLMYSGRSHGYNIRSMLADVIASHDVNSITGKWIIHLLISSLVVYHYPEITPTTEYQNDYDIVTNAMCDYMDGPYTEQIVCSLYSDINRDNSKSEKTRQLRKKLKEAFHIEGTKYPHWIQGSEWPMGQHSPMEYLSRKRDGDRVVFTFRDVDTGEIREVEHFY